MIGFKTGVALYLASTQLPKLFGFKGAHGEFWERMGHFLSHLPETNPASLVLGAAALGLLFLGRRFLPNHPVALLVVVAGIAAVRDVRTRRARRRPPGHRPPGPAGARPASGPRFRPEPSSCPWPWRASCWRRWRPPPSDGCSPASTAIGSTAIRSSSPSPGATSPPGWGTGIPVSGGMSQSLVNEGGGARTPLSGLVASAIVLLVALFLAGLLHDLPQPVLAAIVLMAVTGLFQPSELRRLWRFSRAEFAVAAATLLGVLGSGLLRGVLIGAVISVLVLLRRASRPRTTELGRVPGTDYFADAVRRPGQRARRRRLRLPRRGRPPLLQRRARARPLLRAAPGARGGGDPGRLLPGLEPGA